MTPTLDLDRLYAAIADTLQDDLAAEVAEYIETSAFGVSARGPLRHRFDECIVQQCRSEGTLKDLVDFLGRRNTKHLLRHLGEFESPDARDRLPPFVRLARALGIPNLQVRGRCALLNDALALSEQFDASTEEATAGRARQLGERTLRELSLLHVHTVIAPIFAEVLTSDDKIRLPSGASREEVDVDYLRSRLAEDSWGDLGFLTLLVRRVSARLSRERPAAALLDAELLNTEEGSAFEALTKALQPYVHFRPSHLPSRANALRAAVAGLHRALQAMSGRGVLPETVLPIERIDGIFGRHFVCRSEEGGELRIRTDDELPIGKAILVRQVANPVWRVAGWSVRPWE